MRTKWWELLVLWGFCHSKPNPHAKPGLSIPFTARWKSLSTLIKSVWSTVRKEQVKCCMSAQITAGGEHKSRSVRDSNSVTCAKLENRPQEILFFLWDYHVPKTWCLRGCEDCSWGGRWEHSVRACDAVQKHSLRSDSALKLPQNPKSSFYMSFTQTQTIKEFHLLLLRWKSLDASLNFIK